MEHHSTHIRFRFLEKSLAGLMEFYVDIVTSFYYYDKPYISKTFAILAALICTLNCCSHLPTENVYP